MTQRDLFVNFARMRRESGPRCWAAVCYVFPCHDAISSP